MSAVAWAALVVAAFLAVVDWVAVARDRRSTEYVAKPATMVALIAVALALDPACSGRRGWFVAALVLSLAGDVFLMLPADLFVPGLAAFLLGHVAYIVGLRICGGSALALTVSCVPVLVADLVVGRRIVAAVRSGPQLELLAPVVAYMAVISVMVVNALATGLLLAAVGAVLFFASDALIAWNRFVRPLRWAPVAIMVTYHLAQAGLVLSLVSR